MSSAFHTPLGKAGSSLSDFRWGYIQTPYRRVFAVALFAIAKQWKTINVLQEENIKCLSYGGTLDKKERTRYLSESTYMGQKCSGFLIFIFKISLFGCTES